MDIITENKKVKFLICPICKNYICEPDIYTVDYDWYEEEPHKRYGLHFHMRCRVCKLTLCEKGTIYKEIPYKEIGEK